jgi:hypothetical protein
VAGMVATADEDPAPGFIKSSSVSSSSSSVVCVRRRFWLERTEANGAREGTRVRVVGTVDGPACDSSPSAYAEAPGLQLRVRDDLSETFVRFALRGIEWRRV